MDPNREQPPSSRREFLKLVGLAGLSTTLGTPAKAIAQAAKTMSGAAPADTSKAPAAPAPPSDDAKALASIVQRRYGQHLDADQLKAITDELDGRIQGGQRLRATKLANGDEPDFTFKA
jgi:hypothetical protein